MTFVEIKDILESALLDLKNDYVGRFLAAKKLEAVLQGWPEVQKQDELLHLAQITLQSCYSIQPATWQKADGSPVLLRILDNDDVMACLRKIDPIEPTEIKRNDWVYWLRVIGYTLLWPVIALFFFVLNKLR